MTAWLLRLVPLYAGHRFSVYLNWTAGALAWIAVFLAAVRGQEIGPAAQAAFGLAASALGALGAIDIAVHRLPRQISDVAFAMVVALLMMGSGSNPGGMVSGILLMIAVVGSMRLLSRGSLGAGDLHLAPLLGALIGWFDPNRVLVACVVAATSAATVAIVLVAARRRSRADFIAYGPFMLFGAAIAIAGSGGQGP